MVFAFLPAPLAILFKLTLVDLVQIALDIAEFDYTG
jgi:hypothetical protein